MVAHRRARSKRHVTRPSLMRVASLRARSPTPNQVASPPFATFPRGNGNSRSWDRAHAGTLSARSPTRLVPRAPTSNPLGEHTMKKILLGLVAAFALTALAAPAFAEGDAAGE